jgi:hypothetical protein
MKHLIISTVLVLGFASTGITGEERNFFKFSEECRHRMNRQSSPDWEYAFCAAVKLPLYISDFIAIPFNATTVGSKAFRAWKSKQPKKQVEDEGKEIPEEEKFRQKLSLLVSLHDEAQEFLANGQTGVLLTSLFESVEARDAEAAQDKAKIVQSVIETYQEVSSEELEE